MKQRVSHSASQQAAHGFILPVVLVLISLLALVIGGLTLYVEQQRNNVKLQRAQLQAEIEMGDTFSVLRYYLLTHPYNTAGLVLDKQLLAQPLDLGDLIPVSGTELKLDDTLYSGIGQTRFSIQDRGGLQGLSLTPHSRKRMNYLLGYLGIALDQREQLLDALQDYVDIDDLVRLNGAEKEDYLRKNLSPPPNRPLRSPQELYRVMGWHESGILSNPRFIDAVTVTLGVSINLNTTPQHLLETQPGMTQALAKSVVDNRPYRSLSQASRIIGRPLPFDDLDTIILASNALRIRLLHPDYPSVREINLRLYPVENAQANNEPWIIEYILEHPVQTSQKTLTPKETTIIEFASREKKPE